MKLEELTLFLTDAGLEPYLDAAVAWCEQEGASFIYEISENFDDFAEVLALKRAEKMRLAETFRKQLEHVQGEGCEVPALSQQRRVPGNPSSVARPIAHCRSILCFGDSLTEGYCFEAEYDSLPLGPLTKRVFRPYSEHLERCLVNAGWQPLVMNRGCSGERTESMLHRLPRVLEELAGDAVEVTDVLILAGTNDLATSSAAEIFARLAQLHKAAWSTGARTGILTVPSLRLGKTHQDESYAELNAVIESERVELNGYLHAFANQNTHRVYFVDVAASFPQDETHKDLWENDGVHFTAEGYAVLGWFIAGTMWQDAVAP